MWPGEELDETKEDKVEEIELICSSMVTLKKEINHLEEQVGLQKKALEAYKRKMLAFFERTGKKRYSANDCTVFKKSEFSVKVPATEDDKKELFSYLQDKEIFYKYATVNSRSLCALYRSLLESEGIDFKLPGCAEPTAYDKIAFREVKN